MNPPPQATRIPDVAAMQLLADGLAASIRPGRPVLLEGPLGAGKTVFARALIRTLARDSALEVPSPSFSLIQSYDSPAGPIHHLDLWRLSGPAEVLELGWDDLLDDMLIVEWPDRLQHLRPADAVTVRVAVAPGDVRLVSIAGGV